MRDAKVLLIACMTLLPLQGHAKQPAKTSNPKGTLEITFRDIRNSQGQIAIGINQSEEGWPRRPDMEPNWKKEGVQSGTMTVRLDLPYGTYAISVLDDENSNREMDSTLGIPKEGFGFSQNPKVGMKAPGFEECSFVIDKPHQKITININYMGRK